MNRRSELESARRGKRKAAGKCPNCGVRPPEPERSLCVVCLDTKVTIARRGRRKNPDSGARDYRSRKDAGLCTRCGDHPKSDTSLLCNTCNVLERQRSVRVKAKAMAKYGGSCRCCGETRVAFLTIDHINNNGTAMRKSGEHSGGGHFYKYLIREPLDVSLQVLCWNCNMGRKSTGTCPHVDNTFHQQALAHPDFKHRDSVPE